MPTCCRKPSVWPGWRELSRESRMTSTKYGQNVSVGLHFSIWTSCELAPVSRSPSGDSGLFGEATSSPEVSRPSHAGFASLDSPKILVPFSGQTEGDAPGLVRTRAGSRQNKVGSPPLEVEAAESYW